MNVLVYINTSYCIFVSGYTKTVPKRMPNKNNTMKTLYKLFDKAK
ncbi:MerR family transcriptional regulator [Prevotella nigrescens ATCC 33563]|nr:MerR family transcriptional regulator [Prevotella nigrescens ATCC 33563]